MRKLRIVVFVLLVVIFPVELNAWVYDTHYHLTFASALSPCFDWDEAHLIASADFMIDRNKTTKAESNPLGKRSKRNWHAFGHSPERYTELWTRVLEEPDFDLQLVKFGQFLHFLQDWESHAGFGLSLGHAVATVSGNDPDSMGRSEGRNESQLQSTLDHMAQLCAHLDRIPEGARDSDEALLDFVGEFYLEDIMQDLFNTSDPAWRKGRTGGLSKAGKRILALNSARIAGFIEEHLKRMPEKKIPADFRANSENSSIPRWLKLEYDRDGNVTTAIDAAQAGAEEAFDVDDADSVLRVLEARPTTGGWRVKIRAHNTGETRSEKGELAVVVSDAESGEELGSETHFVGPDGSGIPIPPYSPRWWSITSTGRGESPAVKSYECVPPIDYCPLLGEGPELPALRFRFEAGSGERQATVALDGQLAQDALRACSESRAAGFPENLQPVGEPDDSLRVLTLNVWHGLRSGESKTKFPGEDAERNQRRFNWQVAEIARHRPDVMFFQEVNKNPKESRTYATVFGFDEIHKVASCGIHLGKLLKIPKNVNEGLTILARPDLNLRRVGTERLSGDALCTGTLGFQTKESRYVLFGEITIEGRPVLLAVTHLSSPRDVPPGFEEELQRLVEEGKLLEEQRAEIVEKLESGRARNLKQVEKLLAEIEKQRQRMAVDDWLPPVILAGDFNAQPDSPGVRLVEERGFTSVAMGPDFLTWDPVTNHENHEIGTRRVPPVPTFDIQEIEELLEPRYTTPRQIDYIFISGNAKALTAEMVLNQDRDGLYPSDHFGILATLDWKEPPKAP